MYVSDISRVGGFFTLLSKFRHALCTDDGLLHTGLPCLYYSNNFHVIALIQCFINIMCNVPVVILFYPTNIYATHTLSIFIEEREPYFKVPVYHFLISVLKFS